MQVIKYAFQQHGDDRGQLIALEEHRDIPFEIKRVYYMYETGQGVRRGFHAHKSLEQILICIHGSCKVYISNNMWREMYDFSPDAVLLVLASDFYKEEDYIRNYDDFLKFVGANGACQKPDKYSSLSNLDLLR